MRPSRFVKRILALGPSAAIALLPAFVASYSLVARPSASRHLVLDTRVILATDNARLRPGVIQKDPRNPLMPVDKPWEDSLDNLYANVIYDHQEHLFKLWYHTLIVSPEARTKMMDPAEDLRPPRYNLYATSTDGIVWEKPVLGLYGFDGSKETNIITADAWNTGVFKDLHEADPARRYKMIYDKGRGDLFARFSSDGVHWDAGTRGHDFNNNGDTHNNAFWDARRNRYVCITRIHPGSRLVARTESFDFLRWTEPTVALRVRLDETDRRQLYCMSAFPREDIYLGFLMLYNVAADRTVDCELTCSPDSISWHRVCPGNSFIPRGPAGSYDAGCVYAAANGPLTRNDRLWVYYGGNTVAHIGRRHSLLCLATLRQDGFAGYEPVDKDRKAVIVTQPMLCTDETIGITADAEGGSIRVGVASERMPHDCLPITSNVTDHPVQWKKDALHAPLQGRIVRLTFELDNATLYAFSGLQRLPIPVITPAGPRFRFHEQVEVDIAAPAECDAVLRFTTDGMEPTCKSPAYKGPLLITQDTTVKARLFPHDGDEGGPVVTSELIKYRSPGHAGGRANDGVTHVSTFDEGDEGWRAAGSITWNPQGGRQGGYICDVRPGTAPIVAAADASAAGVFNGDLQARYGGSGVALSASVRTSEPDTAVSFNICGLGISGWTLGRGLPTVGTGWTRIETTMRYDWTDEEAMAAGWEPNIYAMSFADTLRHVVYMRVTGGKDRLDIDDFQITTAFH